MHEGFAVEASLNLVGVGVLLVDDDPDTRELFAVMLTTSGATVRAVASRERAVAACDEATPDVIVSDLGMADNDGYSVLRAIRERVECAGVPVIAVTGHADQRNSALAAGFSDFMVKPIAREALCRCVARAMEA